MSIHVNIPASIIWAASQLSETKFHEYLLTIVFCTLFPQPLKSIKIKFKTSIFFVFSRLTVLASLELTSPFDPPSPARLNLFL